MSKNKEPILSHKLIISYTGMFVIFSFLAFMWHFLTGRTFIWFNDGYDQHYKALIFYSNHLKETLGFLFSGQFERITNWSFLLGEGGDILQILNYYVIGDPLCLISVLFNDSNMYICYCLIAMLRLYLSGLAFLYFCSYKNLGNIYSKIAGALTYTFSIWAIYQTSRHILFLTPLIYLPLVITGIEKILDKKKSILLCISVFLMAISNFYFLYNIVLLAIIYCIVRFIILYKRDWKNYLTSFKDLFINALVGLLMAGVIFIPVCYAFLSDSRTDTNTVIKLLYPLDYYLTLPSGIIGTNSIALGLSAPVMTAVILLFTVKFKGNKATLWTLRALCCISLIFFMLPIAGQIFNGMSYAANKWAFAVPFLLGVVLIYMWDNTTEKHSKFTLIFAGVYLVIISAFLLYSANRTREYVVALITFIVYIVVINFCRTTKTQRELITLAFIALSLTYNSFWINSAGGANYAAEARRPSEILENDRNNEAIAIKNLGDNSFYRTSGQDIYRNGALVTDVKSIMYFWTNTNPNMVKFNLDMEILPYKFHEFENFDDRTILNQIASVKYYSVPEGYASVPYGYEPISTQDYTNHTIYQNPYAMGLTFSTDTLLSQSETNKLPVIARQELLVKGAIVEDSANLNTTHISNTMATTLPYDMLLSDSVTLGPSENSFNVTGDNSVVHYTFSGLKNSETYITFEGLTFNGGDDTYIIISSGDGVVKMLSFYEDGYQYFNGRRDFTVNLGYREEALNDIWIAFVIAGEYTCDNVEISCQPMDNYGSDIAALQEQVLQNVDIHGGHILGNVNFTNQRMLVYTIPYSNGWTAKVDGNTVSTYKVDKKYIGILIDAGEHEVELSYHTPFMNIGILSTVIGMLGVVLLTKKKEIQ